MTNEAAISPRLSKEEALMLSGLQLAYVGDSVHHLMVRASLIRKPARVHEMHSRATERVKASAQAKALERLLPLLTQEETDIVHRGRNAHPRHAAPKSATSGDYAGATGFEALLGFLWLTGDTERLNTLFELSQED